MPRTGWENILIPATAAVVWGLGYSQVGFLTLKDGRVLHFSRFALWIIAAPMQLYQIGHMEKLEYQGVVFNNLQAALAVIMIVFGISSASSEQSGVKWMFFLFAFFCMIGIFLISGRILFLTHERFQKVGTPKALEVCWKLKQLTYLFFFGWGAHPIAFILSGEGACVAHESVVSCLYMITDFLCKNCFGIVYWTACYGLLGGGWEVTDLEWPSTPERSVSFAQSHPSPVKDAEKGGDQEENPINDKPPASSGSTATATRVSEGLRSSTGFMPIISKPATLTPGSSLWTKQSVEGEGWDQSSVNFTRRSEGHGSLLASGGTLRSQVQGRHSSLAAPKPAQGQGMEEVMDHVKSLNQALTDLLVYPLTSYTQTPKTLLPTSQNPLLDSEFSW